ncbi:C6 finger domain [Pyrenophora seminiperda CCB06]|uniref:C6 finger domain n=1 Tax=Pyrenophora seminiperda CCB06 TaxID=1302712 RepID=A0A3M7MFZ6_9PLEO|nr:C6 finger domain [Pyrenophora seminiperda CCB06]
MSGHNIPPQYYNVDPNTNLQHAPPSIIPHASYGPSLPDNPFQPQASGPFVQYENIGQPNYADQFEDLSGPLGAAHGGNGRARRRPAPGEQVKHRRTRSGCYMCRQRRVKCDEARPVCERCKKGPRECIYPDAQSNPKSTRSGSKSGKSCSIDDPSSPEDHEEESKDGKRLPVIVDEDEDDDYIYYDDDDMSKSQDARDSSHTPGSFLEQSASPSTEASSTVPPTVRPSISRKGSAQPTPPTKHSSSMARDLQFYLNYFKTNMSVHHYSLKRDTSGFLKGDFLDWVMKFEPLKYAVAGYAAYFHTLSLPDGRISNFLQFYNESVSRLRIAITKNKKQGLPTFLTILQLASIEEMLGDWVNLMGHQKAAFELLTRLYTPETITQSDFHVKVLLWYIRFDLFVGFQSGGESVLGREWYEAVHNRYVQKVRDNPDNIEMKYEERFAHSRLLAKDSNDLFARAAKGLVSPQDFMTQLPILKERVEGLLPNLPPALTDPSQMVHSIPGTPDPDDIVNPYEPDVIWGGDLWTTNILHLDLWGIQFMFAISSSMALKQPLDPELGKTVYRAIQMFEAICAYPDAPHGSQLEAQVSFAISVIFLPKDPKTMQWVRRTFAKIEASGYIYSDVLRNRMLEMMGMGPSDWWLPNDEGCPPIIRSIKNFIKERTQAPKDQVSDDLREMRGIFNSLTISDSPSSDNMTVTSGDGFGSAYGSPDWQSSGYGSDRKSSNAELHLLGSQQQYNVQ